MLTQNGQVKVMDFGIARALASGATTMTQTSAVIGTAQYLSPEQARGEAVDARSDVYAAGCVLFELLVGHPPFVGDSPVSVAYQHVREDPRAPSDINREVPPDVDAIVLKALAKNPLNRYQSAQEMRADALRAVAGRPVLATPVMNEAETMAMTGPMRQQSAATTMARPVPGMPPPRPPDRKMSSWWTAVLAALGVLAVIALGIGLALSRNNDNNPPTPTPVSMPNLIGMTESEAKAAVTTAGLTNVKAGDADTSEDCDKGKVSRQNPAANTKIEANAAATYSICTGPEQVQVPDNLVGSTRDNADQTLRAAGLEPEFQPVDSAKPKDQVLDVEKAGDQVDPGTKITVKISRGNQVTMPDVVGRSQDAAVGILQQAGSFNVSTKTVQQDGIPGTVVSQDPAANKTVKRGSNVTIVVISDNPNPNPTDTDEPNPGSTTTPPGGNGGGNGPIGGGLLK
jgi:serine/threonine-protein kinase